MGICITRHRPGLRVAVITVVAVLVSLAAGAMLSSVPVSAASAFSSEERSQAVAVARSYANVEVVHAGEKLQGVSFLRGGQDTPNEFVTKIEQGATPGVDVGVDASGLVINAYRSVYPELRFIGRSSDSDKAVLSDVSSQTLYRWNVESIALDNLTPGDLIFFGTSETNVSGVALYTGRRGDSARIIVASGGQGRVVETGIQISGEYWKTNVVGAGRLIKTPRLGD